MVTQKYIIAYLKQLMNEMLQSGFHIRKMVLYGSYSRNEQRKWSDIDVAIVADEFKGTGYDDVLLFSRQLSKFPQLNSIQPRTYNSKDFTPAKDPFVEEILKTGIEIPVALMKATR
jgi:predicted nucleotidyltransferase